MQAAKCVVAMTAIFLSVSSFAQAGKPATGPAAQAVDVACKDDAARAQCPAGEAVGTGLIKCIFGRKRTDKSFTISEGCKTAMMQLRAHRADHMQNNGN